MLKRSMRSAVRAFSSERLRSCASQGDWRGALEIMSELDKEGKTDAVAYELAIEACGRDRRIDAMQTLKETMEKDNIVASIGTIDLFVQLYMHLKQPEKLIQLGIDRLRQNEPISLPAYHSIIDACSNLRSFSLAEEILQALCSHEEWATPLDTPEMAALIRCFGMCRRADFAMHTLFTMQDHGIEPDAEVYTQLIRAHISQGAVNQALHVFSLSNAQGIVLGESIHAATIGALCEKKAFWLATELFSDMEAKGVESTPYCLSRMILAYNRTNNRDAAVNIWNRIVAREQPASIATYMGIMSDCVVTGELDILIEAFNILTKYYTTIPPSAYSFAIRAHGRKGDTDSAIAMMESLIETNGYPQDATTYIAIFNALARASGIVDLLLSNLKQFVERPVEQNRKDIVYFWDLMMTNVPNLQAPAYSSAAGAFASCGDIASLQKLFAHTKTNIPESEALMYSGAISGFSKAAEDYTAYIRDCIDMQIERQIPVNDAAVRAASDAYVRFEKWDDLLHLIKNVDMTHFKRPEGVVGDVISKVLDAQNWNIARFAINAAHAAGIYPHIRSKPHHLQVLADNTHESPEWRIAYSLALETVSFSTINEEHVYAVCNAMKVLFRAEKYNLMARLWYALKSKNQLPLPIDAYKGIVIASLASGFDHSATTAADEMLEMLRQHHKDIIDLTDVSDVFSVIISSFSKYKNEEMVVKLYEEMHNFGLSPNAYAYLAALKAYANLKQVDKIYGMLESFESCMSSTKLNVNEMSEVFSSVISSCASPQNNELIVAIHKHMENFQLVPNSYAQNAIIRSYSRLNQLDKVRDLQESISQDGQRVNDRVVESLLTSYVLANDITNVYATMHQFQYSGDRTLLLYFQSNQPQAVVDFMKAQGHAQQKNTWAKVSPSMQMNALKWLLSRNATIEATEVCTFLLQNGYRVTGPVFEKLLDQLSYNGAYDLGTALLDLYNEKRAFVKTTDSIVESTLLLYNNGQKYDHIQALLTSPRRIFDIDQYTLGMTLCVDGQAYTEAIKIFEALRHRFIEPNGQVFCLALESCQALDNGDIARKILQDVARNRFDIKLQSEMNRRLAWSLTQDARELDPQLTERVAQLALYLEDHGFPMTKSFADKLSMRPTNSYLEPATRTRIAAIVRAKQHSKAATKASTRPWWQGDATHWK